MDVSATWISTQFAGAALGDVRRTRRTIQIAGHMLTRPGASLPQLAASRSDLKATYALWAHPASTPAHLQAGHRGRVRAALADGADPVLLIEDTTVMSWAGSAPVTGLGPIGSGGAAGRDGAPRRLAGLRPPAAVARVRAVEREHGAPRPRAPARGRAAVGADL